jgi:hypothetical protein
MSLYAWFPERGKVRREREPTPRGMPGASRGTDGSNPVPSSAESANHRFLSSRQAITCAGTYQRLQGRRVAADSAIWHRKVRDNGRRYGREHRSADRWAPGPARLLFLPSYCQRSAPTLRSGSPRASKRNEPAAVDLRCAARRHHASGDRVSGRGLLAHAVNREPRRGHAYTSQRGGRHGSAFFLLRREPLHRARLRHGLSRLWLAALRGGFGLLAVKLKYTFALHWLD